MGGRRNNLFRRGVYPFLGYQGTVDHSLEVAYPRGDNTYLALPNQDGYITVYPPKMVARLEENMGDAKLSGVRRRALSMELFPAPIRSVATSRGGST